MQKEHHSRIERSSQIKTRVKRGCLIIFVCTFNRCRSAIAEYFLCKLLQQDYKNLADSILVSSAGIVTEDVVQLSNQLGIPVPAFGGHPPQQIIDICLNSGIDISSHRSTPFNGKMAKRAQLIITMEDVQKAAILTRYPQSHRKVFTFREVFGISGATVIEDSLNIPAYISDIRDYAFSDEFARQTVSQIEQYLKQGMNKILALLEYTSTNNCGCPKSSRPSLQKY